MTTKIHWLGAGLSSAPGIHQLQAGSTQLVVWNRSLDKAKLYLDDNNIDIRELDWQSLTDAVQAGDVLVSMLPATMHLKVAQLCLDKNAHFVSSSYISPEMQALDKQAKQKNLCFVNEVGLDPGIDHLFAHDLVEKYQASEQYNENNEVYFRSYCGGFPKIANDFKYKFSWSPLGVLKALKSPAKWLESGVEKNSQAPWEALSEHHVKLFEGEETFQAYPNRDSIPFLSQYGFSADWNVQQFVRGTLRLAGWSTAWQPLFDQVARITESGLSNDAVDSELAKISQQLEKKYSYENGEPDRVVLSVELEVKSEGKTVWHQSYLLDQAGNEHGQAMSRLVSLPVSIAIEAVVAGSVKSGVSAAPHENPQVLNWLSRLTNFGEKFALINNITR